MSTGKDERRFTAADYEALPEVLTADQVALIVSASPAQVRRWAAAGIIPGRQLGTRWRFSKTLIEQMIREGTPPDQVTASEDDDEESSS